MRAAYRREQQQGADVVFEYGLHVLHVRRVDEIVDVRECAEPDVVRHPQHAVLRLDQPLLLRQDLHRLEDDLLLFRDLRPLARLLTLLHHSLDHCAERAAAHVADWLGLLRLGSWLSCLVCRLLPAGGLSAGSPLDRRIPLSCSLRHTVRSVGGGLGCFDGRGVGHEVLQELVTHSFFVRKPPAEGWLAEQQSSDAIESEHLSTLDKF